MKTPIRQVDVQKIYGEPVFVLYRCITSKFGQTKNSLLEYFDFHVGHI